MDKEVRATLDGKLLGRTKTTITARFKDRMDDVALSPNMVLRIEEIGKPTEWFTFSHISEDEQGNIIINRKPEDD